MPARVSRRWFLGAARAATLAVALPEQSVGSMPPRTGVGFLTREPALRHTVHLYERPS